MRIQGCRETQYLNYTATKLHELTMTQSRSYARLILLNVNKGKTVAQCLADRTDYSENEKKTNNGEFISSYECDPKSCDQEFLLSKRQYQHIHGFEYKRNIIAYQIRQSFKPGECCLRSLVTNSLRRY